MNDETNREPGTIRNEVDISRHLCLGGGGGIRYTIEGTEGGLVT